MNGWRKTLMAFVLVVAATVGAALYLQHASRSRSTDNAYVNADIIQVAASLSGPVVAVHVHEGQLVQAGDPLFELDPEPYKAALALARAKLAQAEQTSREDLTEVAADDAAVSQARADLENAEASARRADSLSRRHFVSSQVVDDAQAKVRVARAAMAHAQAKLVGARLHAASVGDATPAILAARAAVAQAELDLQHTRVLAGRAGWITNLTLVPGGTVAAYQPVFAIVARGSFWVDANFKETELPGILTGQPAEVEIDMLPGQTFHGVVEVVNNGTGSAFSLLPVQNATGNWVKITQRIPVRIRFVGEDANTLFRVGASAQVSVRIKS